MKFKNVTIQNFGTLGEAEVTLDERGLVLVQGDNAHNSSADSNGAGKSTVFEAISWCLYGKTAKGQTGDAVINRRVKKDCVVHVEIEDDQAVYTITRGRKHRKFKSKLHVSMEMKNTGAVTDLTKGTDKLTQPTVEQILGCSYEVFVGAVYAGQEQMPDLPSMTDSKLKVLIEEAAGINVLDSAYTIARQKLADAKSALESEERGLERAKDAADRCAERLEDAISSQERWVGERDARIMDLETSARILLRDAKSFKQQMSAMKSKEDIETQRRLNKNKMDKHEQETSRLEDLESLASAAANKASVLKSKAETATSHVSDLKAQLADLEGHIGKPCTSCKRPHTEESLADAIKSKKEEISQALTDAKAEIKRYKDASSEAQRASQSALDYKSSMTDLSEALALSEALSEQLTKVNEVEHDYTSTLARAKEKTQAIKDERSKINPYDQTILDRRREFDDAKKTLKKIKDDIQPAQEAVKTAQSVVNVFSPKGVRAHILDTVTPYLNERTAHYLGALTDGELEAVWQTISLTAKGEARENFKINVTGDDGSGTFADLSGGEKRKVRVACALALQDLVSTRASKSLDLFIADEIDAALDPAGLERLMGILDEKAKERGSVFIISHSDLRDWVSTTMTVKKVNGISEVDA